MISEWRISRFKSIAGTERLVFKPLTLLVGPNSSGKSSVIQSVLLIAQSLSSQVTERQLVLNGELIKLGTFDDVHNQHSTDLTIGFGFSIDIDLESQRLRSIGRLRHWTGPLFRPYASELSSMSISGDITFLPAGSSGTDSTARPLQADVERGVFRTLSRGRQESLLPSPDIEAPEPDITIERRSDVDVEALLTSFAPFGANQSADLLKEDLRYSVALSPGAKKSLYSRRAELPFPEMAGEVVAARLHHFLPAAVAMKQKQLARALRAMFQRFRTTTGPDFDLLLEGWERSADPIRRPLVQALKEVAAEENCTPAEYLKRLKRQSLTSIGEIRPVINAAEEKMDEAYKTAAALVPGPLPEEQDVAFQALHSYFNDIRYLGPLRDDPKPVYGMAGAVDPMDIGSKGQYTAAVLDINRSMPVEFVPPGGRHQVKTSLGEAVRVWLEHFGIADAVQTVDEGKLGHRLLIRPTGLRTHVDLTNVGVGVSQVLPILVMALVSQPGTTLLFEQPELHLHPAVQSQLADFFISMTQSGRQCLVETHSEYLINRLRLRIAESADDSDLKDRVVVHFVERVDATSRFTEVQINAFGAIPSWPSGFFDQSPNESDSILKAGMAKRTRQRASKS